MQIQPSFWLKLRRLCAQRLEKEAALMSRADEQISRIPISSRGDQHQMTAQLFTMLGQLPKAVEFGFLLGESVPASSYGAISLGMLTAPTLRDSLRFAVSVHHMATPLIEFAFEETASEGRFTIGFRCPIDSAGEALIVAACVSAIEAESFRRSGRAGNIARLELTPSSKGAASSYKKFLSLVPHTASKSNTLIFDQSVLDFPNVHADFDTFNSVVSACAKRAELEAFGVPLQHRVREVIMSHIGAPPTQARLASILDLTPRQLRTCLDREGSSYQSILRSCRIEYASALLQSPSLSLSQIADRLGYSDLSAFSHAFYRWVGKSPSDFRLDALSREKMLSQKM